MCDFSELETVIREMQGKLLRYAENFLKSPESAQDAVQDAFLRYINYVRGDGHAHIENISAWMFRTTRNICLDVLRSARVRLETELNEDVEETAFSGFDSPDDALARDDEMTMAKRLITECLSPREQEILSLKFDHSKSYKEIAEIMELTSSNVGVIIHGAMKKLQLQYRKLKETPDKMAVRL